MVAVCLSTVVASHDVLDSVSVALRQFVWVEKLQRLAGDTPSSANDDGVTERKHQGCTQRVLGQAYPRGCSVSTQVACESV